VSAYIDLWCNVVSKLTEMQVKDPVQKVRPLTDLLIQGKRHQLTAFELGEYLQEHIPFHKVALMIGLLSYHCMEKIGPQKGRELMTMYDAVAEGVEF